MVTQTLMASDFTCNIHSKADVCGFRFDADELMGGVICEIHSMSFELLVRSDVCGFKFRSDSLMGDVDGKLQIKCHRFAPVFSCSIAIAAYTPSPTKPYQTTSFEYFHQICQTIQLCTMESSFSVAVQSQPLDSL
jgi:hypothetical protein